MTRDQNGSEVTQNISRVKHALEGGIYWQAVVWFGDNPATNIRRNVYTTREAARNANISDDYKNTPELLAADAKPDVWVEQEN